MNIITPVGNKEGMVFYGQNALNVQRIFGFCPGRFLQMHADLVGLGLKVRSDDVNTQIQFILYCYALVTSGANVETLIREFNVAQRGDGTNLGHALSLTKIYYHYNAAGYAVRIQKTHKSKSRADLEINNVTCDVKVRYDQTWHRIKQHRELLHTGRQDEFHEIHFNEIRSLHQDLESAFSNRVNEGFRQAACVILDLSRHFHSWNYHRLQSLQKAGCIQGLSTDPVPPIANTCILFSPDNALDLTSVGFNPKAYWGYLQSDGNKHSSTA